MLKPRWEARTCLHCTEPFVPKREAQHYCSQSCRSAASVTRLRAERSDYNGPPAMVAREKRLQAPREATRAPTQAKPEAAESYGWGKPGDPPLLGDDHPLDFYDDGYPVLPACLDRRAPKDEPA